MPRNVAWGGLVLALIFVVFGFALIVLYAPGWVVTVDSPDGLTEFQRSQAISSARQLVLWVAGGIIAVITLVLTWRRLHLDRRRADLDRDANFTDRYTEAIRQLGDEALPIRLGGIYALERIARDSERDRQTILDVLLAFIRHFSPVHSDPQVTRADVSAAALVVGRVSQLFESQYEVDLSDTFLSGVDFQGADFRFANFSNSDLSGANLNGANLVGARFARANLSKVKFNNANLLMASLWKSNLENSEMEETVLMSTVFDDSVMRGAGILRADMMECSFTDVDFTNGKLLDCRVDYGDFTGTIFVNSVLYEIDFTKATIDGADFTNYSPTGLDEDSE